LKIHTLLEKLIVPLFLISLFFIITTFFAYASQESQWQRVFGINLHRVLELVDLRLENTLATWYSSQLFLLTGLAFVLLGWGQAPGLVITRIKRFIFQLTAIGAVLLSADEVGSFHETAGKWFGRLMQSVFTNVPPDDKGFFWIPLFAPLALLGLLAVTVALFQMIANMPVQQRWQRQKTYLALLIALICLPGVFAFELIEWYFSIQQQEFLITTWFEESFEIIGMYSLLLCAILITRQYQL
jgi:hypothetical protein